jgi:hypothetical protein
MRSNWFLVLGAVMALAAPARQAHAGSNLVMNGDFEQFSSTTSAQVASPNATSAATLTSWTNAGYTFLFTPGTAATTGATNTEYGGTLCLWGPGSCGGSVSNGLTATSPTGGNFIGSDGAYQQGAISQTITGLQAGQDYTLSFYWAAGQQQGYTGTTMDSWGVTFGNQTYSTQTITNPSQGFTPWVQQVFTFTATAASQTLAFLASGSPQGTPPFALLDGVVLVATPEPATLGLFAAMLAGFMVMRRSSRRRAATASAVTPA